MHRYVHLSTLFVLTLWLSSCSKPQDLDAPCPDFGRHCPQTIINAPLAPNPTNP